ncbi:hypothetical protein GUITHDRAFT_102152 [Guillardia theta CCMP2712]|uniref:Uncharacterized protein n=1 Tax=Guillardia theta (strain CCMP2712) TaxID=905079 RepID=L1JUK4_GUITC|nr:hypothetical protein GUITHDRAFT_102152 [Guillardia theta CCMP2712]EKX52251.1 hypothetical protein GUITHDRAFT_102152 [Guillardia theta CCMP2712]|eukprot:XP_005839231.1 hypothetical protein GUITHDRAFT_102152 [Guillardia theta CCMP2712]
MQMRQGGEVAARRLGRVYSCSLLALGSERKSLSLVFLSLLLCHAILSPSMASPLGKFDDPDKYVQIMRKLLEANTTDQTNSTSELSTTNATSSSSNSLGTTSNSTNNDTSVKSNLNNTSIMNTSVFIDTSASFSPQTTAAPTTPATSTPSPVIPQLPIGASVIASETLTLPSDTVLQSQGFVMQFKAASYVNVGANIPAGAWPKDDRRVPTLTVVSLNLTAANITLPAASRVGGPVIEYGPSGIKFLLPVRLALPISSTTVLGKSEELVVHVYNQSSRMWERRPVTSKDVPTPPEGIVYGETMSFSMYAALVVPKQKSSKKCGDGCIAGAVIGSIVGFGVLVGGFWYFTQYQKMSSGGSDVEREESGRDESGRGRAPASSQPPATVLTLRQNTPRELHERTEEEEMEEDDRRANKSTKKESKEKEDSDEDDSHYYDV